MVFKIDLLALLEDVDILAVHILYALLLLFVVLVIGTILRVLFKKEESRVFKQLYIKCSTALAWILIAVAFLQTVIAHFVSNWLQS